MTSLMFEALRSSLGRRSVGKRPELMTSILLTSAFFVKLFVNGSFWRLLTRGLRSGCASVLIGTEANYCWVGSPSDALSNREFNSSLLENARLRPTRGYSRSASAFYSSGRPWPGYTLNSLFLTPCMILPMKLPPLLFETWLFELPVDCCFLSSSNDFLFWICPSYTPLTPSACLSAIYRWGDGI